MKEYIILTPVYNDWNSFEILVKNIDKYINDIKVKIKIVVVDDASTVSNLVDYSKTKFKNIDEICQVQLTSNLGHQRAIAVGLSYIEKNVDSDAVLIMDSDGEDNPEDIIRLIQESEDNPEKIVFASRAKRSEDIIFRLLYYLYVNMFFLLTGNSISFGNYSIIPSVYINKIVSLPDVWNHYAAAIIRSEIPINTIPTIRSKRYFGNSKMNFIALVIHGLSSISIFLDKIINKLIIVEILLLALTIFGFLNVRILLIVTLFFITLFIILRKLKKRSYFFSEFNNDLDNLIKNVERY